MNYHGYTVDPEYIKDGVSTPAWRSAGFGEYIVGTKGGVRWFIKRNNEHRFPTEKDEPDKELRNLILVPANEYKKQRVRLHELMIKRGKLSMEKDHIVGEEEYFIEDQRIVIVSRYVDGVCTDVRFPEIGAKEFIRFCQDTAVLLEKLHACGVIHGDLKVGPVDDVMGGNIIAKRVEGRLVPYLIDFDMSYPAPPEKNPKSIPHSNNFESPEEIPYIDEMDGDLPEITTASDIFTLAIVFHRLWTGSYPALDVEKSSTGRCIACDKTVTLDSKFDVKIGKNCGASLISLMTWMLAKEPEKRPTAKQVVSVLKDELEVPVIYHRGCDDKPFTDLWEIHNSAAEISIDYLKRIGLKCFKRITDGGVYKYIVKRDGSEKWMTIEDLFAEGLATRKEANVCEPWSDHNIEFLSSSEIAGKGYVEIARVNAGGHSYIITKNTGLICMHGPQWFLSEGLATIPSHPPIEGDDPWEGDGTYADDEYLAERGVVQIMRVLYGSEKRYQVEYKNKGPLNNVNRETMKKLRLLK